MSSPSRSNKSFEFSAPSPPATTPLALMMSVASLMPGGTSVRMLGDAGAGLVGDEFIAAEVDTEALGIVGVAPGGPGEIAERGAVLGGDLAEIAGPDHAAGAIHVLNE